MATAKKTDANRLSCFCFGPSNSTRKDKHIADFFLAKTIVSQCRNDFRYMLLIIIFVWGYRKQNKSDNSFFFFSLFF